MREMQFSIDIHGYLQEDEINSVIAAATQTRSPIRNKTLLLFLYHTGCRVSEMLGLRFKDILFRRNLLILQTLKRRKKQGSKPVYRYVPLTTELKDQLQYFIDYQTKKLHIELEESTKIFTIGRITVYNVVRNCGEISGHEKVGESWIHPHIFRHSFAINYLNKGGNIRKLQMILGHSSINTTSGYLQYIPEDLIKDFNMVYAGGK